MEYVGERDLLTQWASRKTADDLVAYREQKNTAQHRRSAGAGLRLGWQSCRSEQR